MPRKCIMCGAPQSFHLPVFPFPKSHHERAAWIAVVQQVIPDFTDPQNFDLVTGPRNGICEKHFAPDDIRKGKTSSLKKTAVPVHLSKTERFSVGEGLMLSKEVRTDITVGEDLMLSKETKSSICSEREIKNSDDTDCVVAQLGAYLTNSSCLESKERVSEHYLNDDDKSSEVCFVCGKEGKNHNLFYNLENQDTSFATSISLLTRIVGKPKREIFIVSFKICSVCINLIHEVSSIEENLKMKKQTIKDMFETTLLAYKEKIRSATDRSSPSVIQSHDVNYQASPHSSEKVSLCYKPPNQSRLSSRRQIASKEYYCSSCKESYQSLALWVQHCSKHTDNDETKIADNIKGSHRIKRKKIGVHKCDECDKTFSNRLSLREHAPAHQQGTECNICGRYLSTKARLKAHLFKMHDIGEEKNKEIECNDCKKSFSTKAGLRYHRNVIHHVGTKYVCEQCDKVFYYHVPYKSHMLYAHGEKKVICETCGEKFYTVAKLNIHINAVHRSAKSWACRECKSKFTTDTAYRHHMNVKHLKIQHTCDYCGSNYRKKSSLVTHLLKHSIFICQLCRERFSRTDDLKKHMSEVHGKEIILKGKRKHNNQTTQKRREETIINQKPEQEETVQQNEHVTSIVINDLLIAADSYNNGGLQSFTLSECEKLPEKQDYSTGEELKVEPMGIIDTTSDLQSVDAVQFDTVESLQIKASPDQIEMAPGVSLINVQILGDMEISQSDTLDLKTSMLADAAEHMSHDSQLDNEDNITSRLGVETHHLTASELSVGNDLGSSDHTLDPSDHLETPCHLEVTGTLDAAAHLEVTHQLDTSHQLQVESRGHLEVPRHLEPDSHMNATDTLEGVNTLDSGDRESDPRCLETSNTLKTSEHLEPKGHLDISSHIGDETLDPSRLEATDQCSLPSMISQIDNQVTEEIASHMSPHIHDIESDVDNEITSHMRTDIHDIASEVSSQMVDPVSEDMATHMQAQIDQISANVDEVADDMVTQIDPGISAIGDEVSNQIVDHVETRISPNIDPNIVQEDRDMVDQSLDKQLEKMDSVELEPFSVTLDQKNVQYQYVMYISASTEDSNQGD
ncbi:uncharacterized protein LOC135217418 isoform X2 [Macrobrachium nipponense]